MDTSERARNLCEEAWRVICRGAPDSLESADRLFSLALALDPHSTQALANRSFVRLGLGRLEDARDDALAAVRLGGLGAFECRMIAQVLEHEEKRSFLCSVIPKFALGTLDRVELEEQFAWSLIEERRFGDGIDSLEQALRQLQDEESSIWIAVRSRLLFSVGVGKSLAGRLADAEADMSNGLSVCSPHLRGAFLAKMFMLRIRMRRVAEARQLLGPMLDAGLRDLVPLYDQLLRLVEGDTRWPTSENVVDSVSHPEVGDFRSFLLGLLMLDTQPGVAREHLQRFIAYISTGPREWKYNAAWELGCAQVATTAAKAPTLSEILEYRPDVVSVR